MMLPTWIMLLNLKIVGENNNKKIGGKETSKYQNNPVDHKQHSPLTARIKSKQETGCQNRMTKLCVESKKVTIKTQNKDKFTELYASVNPQWCDGINFPIQQTKKKKKSKLQFKTSVNQNNI